MNEEIKKEISKLADSMLIDYTDCLINFLNGFKKDLQAEERKQTFFDITILLIIEALQYLEDNMHKGGCYTGKEAMLLTFNAFETKMNQVKKLIREQKHD